MKNENNFFFSFQILTSAHCFPDYWKHAIILFEGGHQIKIKRDDDVVVKHHAFNLTNFIHDICAIELRNIEHIQNIPVDIRLGHVRNHRKIFDLGVKRRRGLAYNKHFYNHILVAEGTILTDAQVITNGLRTIENTFYIELEQAC